MQLRLSSYTSAGRERIWAGRMRTCSVVSIWIRNLMPGCKVDAATRSLWWCSSREDELVVITTLPKLQIRLLTLFICWIVLFQAFKRTETYILECNCWLLICITRNLSLSREVNMAVELKQWMSQLFHCRSFEDVEASRCSVSVELPKTYCTRFCHFRGRGWSHLVLLNSLTENAIEVNFRYKRRKLRAPAPAHVMLLILWDPGLVSCVVVLVPI